MLLTQTGLTAFLIVATRLAGALSVPAPVSELDAYVILEDAALENDFIAPNALADAVVPEFQVIMDDDADTVNWADVEVFEIADSAPEEYTLDFATSDQDYALEEYDWEQEDFFGHIVKHLARHGHRIMRHVMKHAPRLIMRLKKHVVRHGHRIFKHLKKHLVKHGRRLMKKLGSGGDRFEAPKPKVPKTQRVPSSGGGGANRPPARVGRKPVSKSSPSSCPCPRPKPCACPRPKPSGRSRVGTAKPRIGASKPGRRVRAQVMRGQKKVLDKVGLTDIEDEESSALALEIVMAILNTDLEAQDSFDAADYDDSTASEVKFENQLLDYILSLD